MPLEHHSQTDPGSVKLSPDELQAVMNDAIRRAGQAERAADPLDRKVLTVEDAIGIGRDLNIPEEHVRAAVADRQRAKLRVQRREMVQLQRRTSFFVALVGAVGLSILAALGAANGFLIVVGVLFWAAALVQGWRWKLAPISDQEADRADVLPVAGTCRVCGAPAYNERATFCEQHRYKGPGG